MPDPLPLAYADPNVDRDRPGRRVDWLLAVLSAGQAMIATLGVTLMLPQFNPNGRDWTGIFTHSVYGMASAAALVGSLRPAQRRPLYTAYGLAVSVGLVLLTVVVVSSARRVYPETYWESGVTVLILNPAWLLLAVRLLRRGMTGWTVRRP